MASRAVTKSDLPGEYTSTASSGKTAPSRYFGSAVDVTQIGLSSGLRNSEYMSVNLAAFMRQIDAIHDSWMIAAAGQTYLSDVYCAAKVRDGAVFPELAVDVYSPGRSGFRDGNVMPLPSFINRSSSTCAAPPAYV